MKQTLLGEPIETYKAKLNREIFLCCAVAVGLLCANVLACCVRTDENHALLFVFNVVSDIVYGSFLLYRVENSISIKKSLLRLTKRTSRMFTAVVVEISAESHRIPGLSCVLVHAGDRVLYLPQTDTIHLEKNVEYTFGVVDNVIVEATT